MEEKFAPELTTKDKRVQEMAFSDARISEKAITETVAIQPRIAVKNADEEIPVPEDGKFEEFTEEELEIFKEEVVVIKEDPGSTPDEKAAADILEEVVIREKEVKERERTKVKVRYGDSRSMFSSIKLYKAPEVGSDSYLKILKYSQKREEGITWLSGRGFAGGALVLSDNIKRRVAGSPLALSGAAQPEVKYADL